ncbi:MAG TPA: PTS sugar transporter subunit IIC [Desulfuromonadales bacterium]|nr:PTS sugar transporter subunit IIC [Desulfuromonadales bacterium]
MPVADYLLAAGVAVGCGLDRTAALQMMISRPLVAGPLTGWVLGNAVAGLEVGSLIELLWLGRLPIGAAVPPDDTQVAVGGTALAVLAGPTFGMIGFPSVLLCTLLALPLGKVGELFDRLARYWNDRLALQAQKGVAENRFASVERCHLLGLVHFGLSSLATYAVIVIFGSVALHWLVPVLYAPVVRSAAWLRLGLPLVGAAVLLGTINVNRSLLLFGVSFAAVLLTLAVL